jgi:hypothetical protein
MRITGQNTPAVQSNETTEPVTQNVQQAQGETAAPEASNAWDVLRGSQPALDGDLLGGVLDPKSQPLAFGSAATLPLVATVIANNAKTGGAGGGVSITADLEKLAKLPPGKQLEYIQQMHAKSPDKFEALVEAINSGKVKDGTVPVAVSIELAASTPWGKSSEGKAVVDQLKTMFAAGKVAFGAVPGDNLAFTKPGKEADGQIGGKGTDSKIILSPKLATTPAAMASILAHEGTHAYKYAKAQTPASTLDSETAANLVGAQVWDQLGGKEKYPTSGGSDEAEVVQQMKDDAAHYDPKKSPADNDRSMRLYIATEYAYSHAKAGTQSRYQESTKMLEEVFSRPDIKDILSSATDSQIKRLLSAYRTFDQDKSVTHSPKWGGYQDMLNEQMDKRKLWTN